MEILIERSMVYDFVKNISHDPNPIHLNENPVVPGDLLVSLYIAVQGLSYVDFSFFRAKKAPLKVEIKEDGIYHEGRKLVECRSYTEIPEEKVDSSYTLFDRTIQFTYNFFNKYFNILLNKPTVKLISVYSYFTNQIANIIQDLYEEVRIAVYTKHAFIVSPTNAPLLNINYHHNVKEDKGKNTLKVKLIYNPYITIEKEVLLKGIVKKY